MRWLMDDFRVRSGKQPIRGITWSVLIPVALPVALLVFGPAVNRVTAIEPNPAYSNVKSLRVDATLNAVAFVNAPDGDSPIGVSCGARGTLLRSLDGGRSWKAIRSGVSCSLHDVAWIDRRRVVVVGGQYDRITRISRGVVLISNDSGETWQRIDDEELPLLRQLRLRSDGSIHAIGDWSHSLLTSQFESHDAGLNWNAVDPSLDASVPRHRWSSSELIRWADAIGVAVAIRDACRVSATELCAVGDHGVIMHSADAGQTWRAVRGQGRRTAVLIVANDPSSVAWSLLGSEALEYRNRVALLLRHPDSCAAHDQVCELAIADQVAVSLGSCGCDRIGDGDVTAAAKRWLIIHRPGVLVLDDTLPVQIRNAFVAAATQIGVARVASYALRQSPVAGGTRAAVGAGRTTLHRNALLPATGIVSSDLFLDAMHWISPFHWPPPSLSLRFIYDTATTSQRGESVTAGLAKQPGQTLAGEIRPVSRRRLQTVQARLKRFEKLAQSIRSDGPPAQFAQDLRSMLDQTAKEDQFRQTWSTFVQLVQIEPDANESSPWAHWTQLQDVALEELSTRFPNTSAARWAELRHNATQHSVEWRRLRSEITSVPRSKETTSPAESVRVSPFQISPSGVQQVSAISPVVVPKPELQNLAAKPVESESQVDLTWEFHPLVLLARDAERRRGDDGQLQPSDGESANLKRLAQSRDSSWASITRRSGPQVVTAHRAGQPPRLDGILDDPCWSSALPSAGKSWLMNVTYDEDYVYLAIRFPGQQLRADTSPSGSRSMVRDQNLVNVDRVRVQIDTDRDFMTAMQLQVSEAGRTHDAIDGIPLWQPSWYVDTRTNESEFVIEVAILRRDLAELPITPGESWFVSADTIRAGQVSSPDVIPRPSEWVRVIFR